MPFRIWLKGSWVLFFLFAAGCRQRMADQPRYDPYQESSFFPDSLSARPLPEGVVSQNSTDTNVDDSQTFPFQLTRDVLLRGQQRFNIYCVPCHGYSGSGDGIVAKRGLRRPPPTFHSDRLRKAQPGYFYDVITNGFGGMASYAYQVRSGDRWPIVAYVRALQLSQWAPESSAPPAELERLRAETR